VGIVCLHFQAKQGVERRMKEAVDRKRGGGDQGMEGAGGRRAGAASRSRDQRENSIGQADGLFGGVEKDRFLETNVKLHGASPWPPTKDVGAPSRAPGRSCPTLRTARP